MKHYQGYKKLFNIAILIFLFAIPFGFILAQTATEIQQQIAQKNNDIDRLEKEIQTYQNQLDAISKQKSSLNGSIQELDLTRKKLIADISITNTKIERTNLKIASLSKDIKTKQGSSTNNTKAIESGIKRINEFDEQSFIEGLLSTRDFAEVWNDVDNLATIREKIISETRELEQIKGELEDTRDETVDAKNELLSLKSKLADQKKIVEQNTAEKKRLLTYTKNNEANYQKLLRDSVLQKDLIETELRDYESKLVYILDPSKLPSGAVFSWPLDYTYITQLFGKTTDSKRLYASGSHSGVDFRAPVGTPVKAMASGIVMGVGDTDKQCFKASFGKWVFIKYDNGLSIAFGHLSLVKAQVGDRVYKDTVVAYSGNTGYSTGPHLHLTVYAPNSAAVKSIPSKSCTGKVLTQPIAAVNAYLNPMDYLPVYKKPN